MKIAEYKCLLISNFTIDNLAGNLDNDKDSPKVKSTIAPFGQVMQVLTNEDLQCWKDNPDLAIVWTQPENVIKSFSHIVAYKNVPTNEILKEVDDFSSLLLNIRGKVKSVFVPTWVFPTYHRGFGMLDMKTGIGISNTLMRMNLRLAENLDNIPEFYVLDTQRWINIAGKNAFKPKLWYMGKIAFGNTVFVEAVKDIKCALRGITGNSKKLIILDADETLWGRIVGEVGWRNIRLGGHDHIGEAYTDFQRSLKSLTNRGILLAIASKNEETTVLEAINNHPEMTLTLEDFSGWKINWQDKAQNIVDLVSELNMGLQSVVFIDDNPVERARIRETLPEVFVPEWPEDKTLYESTLLNLHCFDTPSINKEDIERTKMYASEQQRKILKKEIGSLDEWLKSLNMKVTIEELSKVNLQRTVQLLNKTNQMNLTTRRTTEAELLDWASQTNHKLWTFRISDKFGNSGLTGVISLEVKNKTGKIVDFVLSCRVMGRKLEETMLYTIIKYAQSVGLDELYAQYIPTSKNKPCLAFWKGSGFIYNEEDKSFVWQVNNGYELPINIQIDNGEQS